ncbi:MAG: alpha/beta fold hydrolase [Acidobacteriota bacterium]
MNPRELKPHEASLKLSIAAGIIALLVPWGGCAEPTSFSIEQVLAAPFPSDLVVAPGAQRVAWVFNARGIRNIWVADGPDFTGSARPITRFREDDGQAITSLRLTPDGRTAVFVRGSEANAAGEIANPRSLAAEIKQQVFAVEVGGRGEPRMLGEMGVLEEGGEDLQISPDGQHVVWSANKQLWVAAVDSRESTTAIAGIRGSNSQPRWSPDSQRIAFVSDRDDHSLVAVIELGGKSVLYLSPSADRDALPRWSPDGRLIAFVRLPGKQRRMPIIPEPPTPWSIWVADPTNGAGREVWRSGEEPDDSFPFLTADRSFCFAAGARLVFASEQDGRNHLYSVPVDGGQARLLTPGDFDVEHVTLSADRTSVLYTSNQGDVDRRHVWRVPTGAGAPKALTSGEGVEWSPVETAGGDAVLCLASSATKPATPCLVTPGPVRAIADRALPSDFPSEKLVTPQQVILKSQDGVTVHGQLFVPRQHATAPMPAVIFIHGGPVRQMVLGFHYLDYYHHAYAMNQYLANRGYVVLSVNFRTGIMYGRAFREAEAAGWRGSSEYTDIVAAARYLAARADVDPRRIGLWGGSYGGLLTALALARNSDLFAAGVDLHGVHDWSAFLSWLSDAAERPPDLDEAMRLAFTSSPVAAIDTWRSPVLLIHGDDDRNVPFSETTDLVQRLRAQHVPFEELVLPDEVHDFLTWESWVRVYRATADFLDRRLMGVNSGGVRVSERMTRSADGVQIAYSAAGSGPLALVFIHGGFADRSFWSNQLTSLAGRYRVLAVDLAGHGASGGDRKQWTLQSLGEDVRAVVEAERLDRVVVIGNSMGGPVALEAARLMPGRAIAVIGVDTFHLLAYRPDPKEWEARMEAFRKDRRGTCEEMVKQLFHRDADPALVENVRARMCQQSTEGAVLALSGLEDYDGEAAARAVKVPIGCVNGDLYPTNVEANRATAPGFQAVIMPHMGHYPMLERPVEFDRNLDELITRLLGEPGPKRP